MAAGCYGFYTYPEYYGKPVSLDDRFETVLIWNHDFALLNKGQWKPKLMTQANYEKALVLQEERNKNPISLKE